MRGEDRTAPDSQAVIVTNPGAFKAAADVAGDTISALGAQPVLLLIVLLNMIFCGGAAWFLDTQERFRHVERVEIIGLLSRCVVPDNPARKDERP